MGYRAPKIILHHTDDNLVEFKRFGGEKIAVSDCNIDIIDGIAFEPDACAEHQLISQFIYNAFGTIRNGDFPITVIPKELKEEYFEGGYKIVFRSEMCKDDMQYECQNIGIVGGWDDGMFAIYANQEFAPILKLFYEAFKRKEISVRFVNMPFGMYRLLFLILPRIKK